MRDKPEKPMTTDKDIEALIDRMEIAAQWDDIPSELLNEAATTLRAQQDRIRELEAERDQAIADYNRVWQQRDAQRRRAETAEAKLAEARKVLGMMLKEHDILSGNFGDVMDPKHKRPDRWPTAADAARSLVKGGGDE